MGFEVGVGLVGDGDCVDVGGGDVGIEVDVSVAIAVATVEIAVSVSKKTVGYCEVGMMDGPGPSHETTKKTINIPVIINDKLRFLLQSVI